MEKKNKVISVRVTEGFNAKLERLARKEGRSKGDWIRRRITPPHFPKSISGGSS